MKKIIFSILSLFIFVLIIWGVFGVSKALKIGEKRKVFQDKLTYKWNIFWSDFQEGLNPKRKRPLTLLERQEKLKHYFYKPFTNYSDKEWQDFWNLIYGVFPKGNRKRQLTQDEIEEYLRYNYPKPFKYFKEIHWRKFWSIILYNR